MIYQCLIADDDFLARDLLKDYIQRTPSLELVSECKNGVEVIKALQENTLDLLFLDIQMPHLKGTEVVKAAGDRIPAFIFTTAYKNYAIEAFDLNAADYLLKPFSFERFQEAVQKAIGRFQKPTNKDVAEPQNFMMVKSEHKLIKVKFEDILYIEGLREYVKIITNEGQVLTLDTMKNMEVILPNQFFIRIHKSYIIAFDKIKALHGNQVEIQDTTLPIGRTYRQQLMEKLER